MDNIKKGRVLRDTLFGCVRIGTATLKTPTTAPAAPPQAGSLNSASSHASATSTLPTIQQQEIVIVIKEYEKELVERKQTRQGHSVNEDAKSELRIHAMLCREPCPHIIRLYDLRADATHYYAVLENAAKGEFFAIVSHPNFTRDHARHFFKQLAIGVAFMHQRGIAHRDLSLENILLDEQHILKICDFGVACEAKPGQAISEAVGPVGKLKYMAPEVFARHPYDPFLADVWSMGVMLFIMLVQVFPFDRPSLDDDRFVHACSDRINSMLHTWGKPLLDHWTIDLFRHIFCPTDHRYTAAQILEHPYCTGKAPAQKTNHTTAAASSASSSSSGVIATNGSVVAVAVDTSSTASQQPSSSSSAPNPSLAIHQQQQQHQQMLLIQQQQQQEQNRLLIEQQQRMQQMSINQQQQQQMQQ